MNDEIKVKKVKLTMRNRKTGEETELVNAENAIIKMMREKEPDYSHRTRFDKNKDALLHPQIGQDVKKIMDKFSYTDKNGFLKGKYLIEIMSVSPKPKTQQSKSVSKYKKLLKEELIKRRNNLAKFKNKKLLIYICIYLRKERYEQSDVDNFIKPLIDGLKEYFGDDNKVQTVIAEKKQLDERYDEQDFDFLECSLVAITDFKARDMVLNF